MNLLEQASDIKQKLLECNRAIGEARHAGCDWVDLHIVAENQIQITTDFLAGTWRVLDHIEKVAKATTAIKAGA